MINSIQKGTFLILLIALTINAFGQQDGFTAKGIIDGQALTAVNTTIGDTLYAPTSTPKFENTNEHRRYERLKSHVNRVSRYANETVETLKALEIGNNLDKEQFAKLKKELPNTLELSLKEPSEKLFATQTKVLVEMIERDLNRSLYDVLKEIKGKSYANSWFKFYLKYDIDIKEGYDSETDSILEFVLNNRD